jgi:hypothetical protein
MTNANDNPMGVEWFGMIMGLGFVLSFGYWCTDFFVVQRPKAANSMTAARRTPLIAALPKMFFPFLVILPGMIAGVAASSQLQQAGVRLSEVPATPPQSSFFVGGRGIIPRSTMQKANPSRATGKWCSITIWPPP